VIEYQRDETEKTLTDYEGRWRNYQLLQVFVFNGNFVVETVCINTTLPTVDNLRGNRARFGFPRAERCGEPGTLFRI